ncbi:Lsr2 family DNA-binding protein [Streptomyces avermitilis]|uniref:Lsr2 family DNA-binding protein n=1 Tax=Streptomyces avermitilis TaxID=33903 RepID=UPI003814B1A8
MTSLEQGKLGFPVVRKWPQRSSSTPWVPGSPDQIIENLRGLLAEIKSDGTPDRSFAWPTNGATNTIRAAVHSLGSCGLVNKKGDHLELSDDAEQFLVSGDSDYLIATFHSNVRFMGELLAELETPKTHSELNSVASEKYLLEWSTLDQVRRRTNWLRAAGLTELWKSENKLALTDEGRKFRDRIQLVTLGEIPGSSSAQPVDFTLAPPSPKILAELETLDQSALASRKTQWGYIAGGSSLDNIKFLVNAFSPESSRAHFVRLCVDQLSVKESSAEQSLNTLRALGFVEQTGLSTFAPTLLSQEWLTSEDPLDLVRILHVKVALVAEVLSALKEENDTGAARRWLATHYPSYRVPQMELARRILILKDAGLIERIGHTRYRLTPLGERFYESVPLLEPQGILAEISDSSPKAAGVTDHSNEVTQQAVEVYKAATDSANFSRFESAVAKSFSLLGLEVERHGGPKKTDLLLTFWISPTDRRRVTVEVKTASAGQINENDVKFDALEEHRKAHKADRAILVGPGFSGRLPQWAKSKDIPLISAGQLATWLTLSSRMRVFPHELYELIFSGSVASVWERAERGLEAVNQVTRMLWESGNDENDIAFSKGALTVRDIWRMGKGDSDTPLAPEEITSALQLMTNPLLSAASEMKGGEYVSMAPPHLIASRLRSFADAIEYGMDFRRRFDMFEQFPRSQGMHAESEASRTESKTLPERVRKWARENGRPVSAKGRLPNSLISEFLAAQNEQQ